MKANIGYTLALIAGFIVLAYICIQLAIWAVYRGVDVAAVVLR